MMKPIAANISPAASPAVLTDLKSLDPQELEEFIRGLGHPAYRARQVMGWIYRKGVEDFASMTNLGARLCADLQAAARISRLKLQDHKVSPDRETEKFLFGLEDGLAVESVLMRYSEDQEPGRVTVCVSTQVGCALGCRFCASGLGGKVERNLSAAEMVDQVLQVEWLIRGRGERVANVVFMGMGEPLANYVETLKAVRRLNSAQGPAIGIRRITISTAGLVPGIRRLAEEGLALGLAISLHGADNQTRSRLMPINDHYPLEELMEACREYQRRLGRRLTVEYVLIKGENDSLSDAAALVDLLTGLHVMVNLIPYNPVAEFPWKRPNRARQEAFLAVLRERGQAATLRTERGLDLEGACGQLRRRHSKASADVSESQARAV